MISWEYAAGFIDADGSMRFFNEYGSKRLCLSASQNTRPVLDELQALIGHGGIFHRENGKKGLFVYRTTGLKIVPALRQLEPFLIVKKAICNEMIQFADERGV